MSSPSLQASSPIAAAPRQVKHRYVLAATARWESDTIVEWITYYQFIGFDHIYLYCNDDDPTEFFERILPFVTGFSPLVTFYYFPLQGQQEQMWFHFLRTHREDYEWACFFDCDEFLVLKDVDDIQVFMSERGGHVDAVHFHSVSAGHCGHVERPQGSVIENFYRRSRNATIFTKCIFRAAAVDESRLPHCIGVGLQHNIEAMLYPHAVVVNVAGTSMRNYYRDPHASFTEMYTPQFRDYLFSSAFIYHIGMKSQKDLLRRAARGLAGVYDGQIHWKALYEAGPAAIEAHFAPLNELEDRYLQRLWQSWMSLARQFPLTPVRPGRNIAVGRRCLQSSVSIHSRHANPEDDAAGVVDGKPNGRNHHCTEAEAAPWWQVDLGDPQEIRHVWIFNRVDGARDRLRNFRIDVRSTTNQDWTPLMEKTDDTPFGGVDGRMFIWSGVADHVGFLRITLLGHGFLDLDQVEIYQA